MFELSDFYGYCEEHDVDLIVYRGAPRLGITIRDGDYYAIFLDFDQLKSTRLIKGVCYHEMGHAATGALHKVSSPYDLVERSEYRANRWAAEHFLPVSEFREAFAAGYTELWQLSEFFDLPEDDVQKALVYWTQRRGLDLTQTTE